MGHSLGVIPHSIIPQIETCEYWSHPSLETTQTSPHSQTIDDQKLFRFSPFPRLVRAFNNTLQQTELSLCPSTISFHVAHHVLLWLFSLTFNKLLLSPSPCLHILSGCIHIDCKNVEFLFTSDYNTTVVWFEVRYCGYLQHCSFRSVLLWLFTVFCVSKWTLGLIFQFLWRVSLVGIALNIQIAFGNTAIWNGFWNIV
jgi:hypothetical protein